MQKKNNSNQNVGAPDSESLAFSAIRFYAFSNYGWEYRYTTHCDGVVRNKGWDRTFSFQLDCGDQANDKYIFNPLFSYTYSTSYYGGGVSGGLSNGSNKFYRDLFAGAGGDYCAIGELNLISYNGHDGYIIDEIKIYVKPVNSNLFTTIDYKNIRITGEFRTL